MKPSEVLRLVARFELTFGRPVGDEAKQIWLQMFTDIDAEDATQALDELAAEDTYPPTPQRIRRAALEQSIDVPTFGEAWAEMVESASTCNYFSSVPPTMSHPAIDELARQVGWSDFRVSNPEDTYYQHSARARYEEIVDRSLRRALQGLSAFEERWSELEETPHEMRELVEGIGDE